MDKEKFGTFIKDSRIKKNYTQKQLADKLFIDTTAVSKWERGISYPDITLVPEICKVLDINEHELIVSSNDTEYRKKMKDADKYNRIKNIVFYTTSILYLIAIVTCFIVNMAIEHKLTWFWLVLTSCITAFTFFPTITRLFTKCKFLVFVLSSFTSLFLLFLTCSIYGKNYWFPVATIGTLIGYFAIFYPILFNKLKMYLSEEKFNTIKKTFMITYSMGLLLLTLVLLTLINIYTGISDINKAFIITTSAYGILITYGLIEFLNINRYFKLAIDFLLSGIELLGFGFLLNKLLEGEPLSKYKIDFSDWNNYINGNIMCLSLSAIVLVAIIFIILGINKKKKQKNDLS